MNVLVVDGPARGQIHDTKSTRFLAMADIAQSADPFTEVPTITYTYHVHQFAVAGRLIMIASVHLLNASIHESDVFEAIISDAAKAAAK